MKYGEGKIWYDGKFVNWGDANVNIMAHAIHYGSSIFEGLRCYNTVKGPAIFRLDEHLERFYDSAKIYRMNLPFNKDEFKKAIIETVRVNNLQDCYIRPFAFRGADYAGVYPLKNKIHTAVSAWEWGKYLGEEAMENGVSVRISSWRRLAPNTIPALAKAGGMYLNSQLIKMEAVEDGYEEGIALDKYGFISEGSGENIFMIRHGVLYTPPTSSSILAGITRHSVFCIARDLDLRIEQHKIPREALYIADEIFFTGTAAEITPISKVDKIAIGNGKRGPLTQKIQQRFFDIVSGKHEDNYKWLTFV